MRIASGPQGYYYDQGRFKRPDIEADDAAQTPAAQPARAASFSPVVESSTVLSTSLSSALWQLETQSYRDDAPSRAEPVPMAGATDEDTADKVRALYLEYADDSSSAAA